MARKPESDDYDTRETAKFFVEIGGEDAEEFIAMLSKLTIEISRIFYENTKEHELPTVPVHMGAFQGIAPGWIELRDDMAAKLKDPEYRENAEKVTRELMEDDTLGVKVERLSSEEASSFKDAMLKREKDKREKKNQNKKSKSGSSFLDSLNDLF